MKEIDDFIRYLVEINDFDPEDSVLMRRGRAVFEALDERLSALYESKADKSVTNDNVTRDMEQHRAFDKRLSALEANDKCQNCAVSPYIEAEKHTCGECRYPWSREHFGRPEQWLLVCDRVDEEETVGTELERVSRSYKACPNFEARDRMKG